MWTGRTMWFEAFALSEDIQQDIDVHREGHACFFSKWARCASSPTTSGKMTPLACSTSGCAGRCRCARGHAAKVSRDRPSAKRSLLATWSDHRQHISFLVPKLNGRSSAAWSGAGLRLFPSAPRAPLRRASRGANGKALAGGATRRSRAFPSGNVPASGGSDWETPVPAT